MEIRGKEAEGDAGKDEEADKCKEMEGDDAPLVSIENFCIFVFYFLFFVVASWSVFISELHSLFLCNVFYFLTHQNYGLNVEIQAKRITEDDNVEGR